MNPTAGGDYNYESAGFDGFMSRSIDNLAQVNLASPGPQTTSMAFDRTQVTGGLGDSLKLGNITLDGVKGRISVFDSNGNEIVRLGDLDD